jgi:hypothetical protein
MNGGCPRASRRPEVTRKNEALRLPEKWDGGSILMNIQCKMIGVRDIAFFLGF